MLRRWKSRSTTQLRGYQPSGVSFLIFSLYLLIIATTIEHRQLFLADPVKLPVLNIDLPLWGFFFLAPILFVIFHAYVLLQVYGFALNAQAPCPGGCSGRSMGDATNGCGYASRPPPWRRSCCTLLSHCLWRRSPASRTSTCSRVIRRGPCNVSDGFTKDSRAWTCDSTASVCRALMSLTKRSSKRSKRRRRPRVSGRIKAKECESCASAT